MTSLDDAREQFAEEVRQAAAIESNALVRAMARVPRERFLGEGPWLIRSERHPAPTRTPDADPRHVLHNVAVALDASRDLYNGGPATVAGWIEGLAIAPGDRIVHIGCGTGYYTAWLAELTGPEGHVTAIEVDDSLAARAVTNLADWAWVSVVHGNGLTHLPREADVVLVHAGASHIVDEWIDLLSARGRMLLPLTCTIPAMGASLGKGVVLRVTRDGAAWIAQIGSMVAIYSLQGNLRDESRAADLGRLLMSGQIRGATRVRRDPHAKTTSCLMHSDRTCLSSG